MLNIEIECMPPENDGTRVCRLLIGGVNIFESRVFDTNPDGKRTVEWARLNLLKLFGERLKRSLEDER